MAKPRKPGMSGPKLTPEARRVLIGRIVAGASNPEILEYLHCAGHLQHPCDLARSTLARYRNLPEVLESVREINLEHSQAALAVRGRRIRIMTKLVMLLYKRLGLSDNVESIRGLEDRSEISVSSPQRVKESDDSVVHVPLSPPALTVSETCELAKALVTAMQGLNRLLDDNAAALTGGSGSRVTNALGAFDQPPVTNKIETKASRRALFNDFLEEAIREEKEERAAEVARAAKPPETTDGS